ncbi:hypothetical protein OUZ56_029540 [Daphnia magna]|uniref:MULE transposase domain-containing protein n=1 Tax=Daphnia magna TaxID=35525 RepID=A0ABR0B740_9CRUS|nr:hypothetical protein OUZ56_029540 [Daphnia magna]
MQIIYEYMGSYWFQIVTPDRLSVNGQPRRTTNEVESFHRWFNRRCGKYHQSFWTFIGALVLAKSRRRCVKDYNLARSGRLIRREHAKKQTEKDARIRTFCQSFDNREITVYQFLEMCSRFFEPLHNPAPLGGLLADPFDSYHKNSVSDKKKTNKALMLDLTSIEELLVSVDIVVFDEVMVFEEVMVFDERIVSAELLLSVGLVVSVKLLVSVGLLMLDVVVLEDGAQLANEREVRRRGRRMVGGAIGAAVHLLGEEPHSRVLVPVAVPGIQDFDDTRSYS